MNGLAVTGIMLVIISGIAWVFDRADKRDRAKVAEAIKNGTLWGPTNLPAQRRHEQRRIINRW